MLIAYHQRMPHLPLPCEPVAVAPWQHLLGIPTAAPPQGSEWFQIDGMLQASSLVSCVADLHLARTGLG
jgi:hypothetical protein